jgi:lambda family phage portal protein
LHIVEQSRIDQTRGISELVAALKEMRTTKQFRDIMLQNAVVNATFAASIESELPSQSYEALGGGDSDPLVDFAENYLGAVSDYAGGARSLTIDGVRIPHLYPGQKLQLRPAGANGPLGTEFEASLLRYIAADLGVSYEELSRDYSNANYSSMKKAAVQTERRMASKKRMVADRFATCAYRLWFEEALNNGQLETMKGRPDFYDGMNKDAYTACEWLGSSRGQIDELKETQAAMLRVNNNLGTLEGELGRLGLDWRQVLKQRKREKELVDELGLTPPVDNKMSNALTGDPRESRDDNKDDANA